MWKMSPAEITIGAQQFQRGNEDEALYEAGCLLRDALSTLTADNEHRGSKQGADVNWAAIHQARSALMNWTRATSTKS